MSERMKFRQQNAARHAKLAKAAGDPTLPEGQSSEERKNYPKLLREPYQFTQDINAVAPDDVILESGCNGIVSDI